MDLLSYDDAADYLSLMFFIHSLAHLSTTVSLVFYWVKGHKD